MRRFNPARLLKQITKRSQAPLYHHFYLDPTVHKYQIAPHVEYAKFWSPQRRFTVDPQDCFLIRREQQYVGIVTLDYGRLGCFMLPRFRDSGYLFPALRSAILPYLFLHEKYKKLKISIKEDYLMKEYGTLSKSLLLLLDFKEVRKDEFELSREDFDYTGINLDFHHPGMTLQQFDATKFELDTIAKRLLQLDAHLEAAYGKNTSDTLKNLGQQVKEHQDKLVQRAVYFHKGEADDIEREYS